jgi:hypothetical protein
VRAGAVARSLRPEAIGMRGLRRTWSAGTLLPSAQARAKSEKVESPLPPTRRGVIQAACWAGGQQRWASPMRTI